MIIKTLTNLFILACYSRALEKGIYYRAHRVLAHQYTSLTGGDGGRVAQTLVFCSVFIIISKYFEEERTM
jgi:hypothetical protein